MYDYFKCNFKHLIRSSVCACARARVFLSVHVCACGRACVCMYSCVYMRVYVCVYTCMRAFVCVFASLYARVHEGPRVFTPYTPALSWLSNALAPLRR